MKRLVLCLLFVLASGLAGCEQLEGSRHERNERVQISSEMQQIEVTVVH